MRPEPRLGPPPCSERWQAACCCSECCSRPEETFAALPLLGLLVALVFKLYPGERLIARLAERLRPRRPRATSTPSPTRGGEPRRRPALAVLATVRPLGGPPALRSQSI